MTVSKTPFGKTGKILGGAATYISLAASNYKAEAAIVSVVGDDMPKEYLDIFSNKNIDLSGLKIVKGGKLSSERQVPQRHEYQRHPYY